MHISTNTILGNYKFIQIELSIDDWYADIDSSHNRLYEVALSLKNQVEFQLVGRIEGHERFDFRSSNIAHTLHVIEAAFKIYDSLTLWALPMGRFPE